jgi:hypothetical protein
MEDRTSLIGHSRKLSEVGVDHRIATPYHP